MHLAPGHKYTLDLLRACLLSLLVTLIVPCTVLGQPVFGDDFDRPNSSNIGNGWVRFIIWPNTGFGDSSSGSSTHGNTAFDIVNGELRMGEISGNNTAFHGFCERDAGAQSLIDDGTYQFEVRFGGANAAGVGGRPAYYGMAFYKTPFEVDGMLVRIHRNGNIEFWDSNGSSLGTLIDSGTYPAFSSGVRKVKIEITGGQTLKVKIWDANDPEPAAWNAQTDISAVGKPGTYIALYAHTTGGDNTDIHYFYDNFSGTAIPTPFQEVGAAAGVADTGNGWMVSWADYDGDGKPDLHVPNENQADSLFHNNGDGTFTNMAAALGVDDSGQGQGVAWADYDNDGDLDFYLAKGPAANRLFQNQLTQTGTAGFVDVAESMQVNETGASTDAGWADMDLDGDVDLYVTGYLVANRLYRNDGALFVDIATNPGTGTTAQSAGVSWADYDDDGDPDIYLTQENNVSNALFRNDGNGTFAWVQSALGVADASAGRGAPWGDYDNDGDLDLYLAKSTSTTGGNMLFQNPGDGTAFTNVASGAGVADGSPTFGAEWGDYDNDGDLDLATANWLDPNRLYENDGSGSFTNRAAEFGMDDGQQGRGLAWADYDLDGDIDLYVANGSGGANLLYRNDNVLNNWLHVDLEGTVSNRSGLGAKVRARVGGTTQRRDVLGSTGQTSHESLTQEFGLGAAATVDELTITWPSGIVQTYTNVAVNQGLTITESITVDVSIPHVTATYNSSVTMPIQLSNTSDGNIVSAEVFISYDGDLLTAFSVGTSNTLLTDNWSVETNIVQGNSTNIDTIKIAMATNNDVLAGAGTLININFQVADIRHPASSPLTLEHVLFNDGTPGHTTIDGSVTLVGTDGTVASAPATIIPREDITVTVTDVDEDLDGSAGTDQVGITATNPNNGDTVALTLDEDAITPGQFSTVLNTEFGTAAIADNLVQAQAGDAILFSYDDQLDANGNGPIPLTAQTDVIGGKDGSVEITLATQPGDVVYIQASDADLNTDPGNPETVVVTVTSSNGESEEVTLTEVDVDDDVFFGSVNSTAGASAGTDDDGTFNAQKGDVLTATYVDVVTEVGSMVALAADDQVIDPFGDADGNGAVQAFDAAQVLLHVLAPFLTGLELIQANVDTDPVGTGINPFDASLILQKRVGLITLFPVQLAVSTNHPQPTPATPKPVMASRWLTLSYKDGYWSLRADERSGIVSGDLLIEGVDGTVAMAEELSAFLMASRASDEGLRIVFAGAEPVSGPGELLRIYPGVGADKVRLSRAQFNGGSIEAQLNDAASLHVMPLAFVLHANVPNPFNPETTIRFELPQESAVKLEVFDVLGQRVRTLVSQEMPAGAHQVVWDGRNERGIAVGNGLYLYRLEAGDFAQMRGMLLLK